MDALDCKGPTLRDIITGKTDFRPSREALREFLFDQANNFISTQKELKPLSRKERRLHARAISKRIAQQMRSGELK